MPKLIAKLPTKPENYAEPQKSMQRVIQNITFFGDSSLDETNPVYIQAFETAKLLAQNGYTIVNGGGPGVMKAATDGAESVNGETIAVYWEPKLASIFEGKNLTNVTDKSEAYSNYMMRTLGLIEKGHVYVIMLGGTGTISELGMVWALAKLYFGKHKPVILLGGFWPQLINSLQKYMLLDDNELGVLHYATSPEQVLELIKVFEVEVESRMHKTYEGDETPYVLAPRFSEDYKQQMLQKLNSVQNKVQNSVALTQLTQFSELVQSPAKVLQIGCVNSSDLNFLSKNYSVIALEPNPEYVEGARFQNPNAEVLNIDLLNYELQENVFKGIWARDVLHFYNPAQLNKAMQMLSRALVPGGILQFIVREGDGQTVESDMEAGAEVKKQYFFFNKNQVSALAREFGLTVVKNESVVRSHNWLNVILQKP